MTGSAREFSFGLVSAFVHGESSIPVSMINTTEEQVLDLAMVAAALLRCWAGETGIPAEVLLADLAIGQVIEEQNRGTPSPKEKESHEPRN